MKTQQIWKPLFSVTESGKNVVNQSLREEVEDIEIRITESPPERDIDFKALDLNGLTLSFDADVVHIVYGYDGLTYVSVMGNLIVLYDQEEDLDGHLFAAETIQKIKTDGFSKSESRKRMQGLTR